VASRDIKLENTLLDSSPRPLVKICDFGYSKHEKFQSAPGSRVGTPAYLAPEVIMTTKGQTYDGKVPPPPPHPDEALSIPALAILGRSTSGIGDSFRKSCFKHSVDGACSS